MGIFDKIFQGNKVVIGSPVNGKIVPIDTVSDPTFAQEMPIYLLHCLPDEQAALLCQTTIKNQ